MKNYIKVLSNKLNLLRKIIIPTSRNNSDLEKSPRKYIKFTLITFGALATVAFAVFFGQKIISQYDTYIIIPSHFTAQEREQTLGRWRDILSEPEKGKNSSGLYNNIGILRAGLNDYRGAIRSFKLAIRRNPGDLRFYRNIGITYTYMEKFRDAEKAFQKAFQLAPKQSEYWLELGELYAYRMNDLTKAKFFYLEAIEKNPDDINLLRAYANFEENLDMDIREAMKYWEILIQKDGGNKSSYLDRIQLLKKKLE